MDDLVEIKSLIGDVHTAFEALKQANDENLKKRDALLDEKLAKINTSIDEAELKSEALQKDISRQKIIAEVKENKNVKEDIKKLLNYMRTTKSADLSNASLDELEQKGYETKGYQVSVDSQGGYVIQPEFVGVIAGLVREISPIRGLASVRNTSNNSVTMNSHNKSTNFSWDGEGEVAAENAISSFQEVEIPVHKLRSWIFSTQEQLDDAGFDFESWLLGEIADGFAQGEGAAFVTGNGFKKPKGFMSYVTTASDYEFNKIRQIVTGSAASFTTDSLINLQAAMKTAYLARASFVMNRASMGILRTLQYTGGNGYIWQPSYQAGRPSVALGCNVVEVPDMAAVGASNLPIALADFSTAYQIVDRTGFRVIRDEVTTVGTVKFYATRRVGGAVKQFDAIKILRCST